jgi:acyl-CoA thioester hydrolase
MKKNIFTTQIDIRWGDLDALNHVNNTLYFRYLEETRIRWFETLKQQVHKQNCGPVIVTASCEFLQMVTYPEKLEIRLHSDPPGRSSVNLHHDIIKTSNNEIAAKGQCKVVWIDYQAQKSTPLPDAIRHAVS